MTAANVVVVEEAGTSSGSTILLFAGGCQGLAHHPGPAGLQAVTARNEEVLVLKVARASALGTVSSRIPDDYFRFIIFNILVLDLASLHCWRRGETRSQ